MTLAEEQIIAAEAEWLERWSAGPTEAQGSSLRTDAPAPDLTLLDHTGRERTLSEFWADGPALVMFWRHFGCGCGFERASRLNTELNAALASADIKDRFHKLAAESQPGSPEDFRAFIVKEIPKWRAMADLAGVKAE